MTKAEVKEFLTGLSIPIMAVGFAAIVHAVVLTFSPHPQEFQVEIEFTDGTKRTIQFESIERPKVIKNGCLYDYSKRSWICGVRDMSYKICSK